MGSKASLDVVSPEADNDEGIQVAESGDAPDRYEWSKELNIFARLMFAQKEAQKLEKNGEVKSGTKKLYDYVLHDDVAEEAKKVLTNNGIAVFFTITNVHQESTRTELMVKATFVNVDDPKDAFESEAPGYGIDSQDKGPGKAYSYACKYILAKT